MRSLALDMSMMPIKYWSGRGIRNKVEYTSGECIGETRLENHI